MQSSAAETTPLLGKSNNQAKLISGEFEGEPITSSISRSTSISRATSRSRYGSISRYGSMSRYGSLDGGYPFLSGGIGMSENPTDTLRRPSIVTMQCPVSEETERGTIHSEDEDFQEDRKPTKFLYGVSDSQFWPCYIGIALACFVTCFDSTLMASSHPVITSYFDASNSASWLSTSFLLTSTAFQPMFGRISDTFGRKTPFVVSLWAFLLGTLWCALAPSILQFIFARAVCGLGAAGALSLGTIIIGDMVPLEARGGYLSFLNLASGVGSSLGVALGGFLAETLGWRWEFGIQVPAIGVCLLVAQFSTPPDLGPMLCQTSQASHSFIDTMLSFDLAGSALLTSSVTFLILALNLGGNLLPWNDPFIILFFILFFILGAALIHVERSAEKPVMPLYMLFNKPQGNLIFSNFLGCMTMSGILFNLPLYFQAVLLDTPTLSGTRLIVPFIANMITSFITGNYISYSLRFQPTLVLGAVLILLGSVGLTIMPRNLPAILYSWLPALATGGQGFHFPTTSIAILAVNTEADMAIATSTLILFRSLGTVMGVAVSSLVAQNGLKYFLEQTVTGPQRLRIIREVRMSVEAIRGLEGVVKAQVISAYASTMHLTFALGILTALVSFILIIIIRLPRLSKYE
ncbi:MFS multidrug transporter [Microthyrium microscopicum]|uniref:MFS multidrug transporter n=1 Tax=Microthyrium microscopicum TaxID=703497 RepID=A0A6A6U2T4_9PEZI|nr:MFS multidrug transporter [Microthyrium microscopicum]